MRLTVLGNSSRYLLPLGTGTTYLLDAGDDRIVFDAGNGTADRLAAHLARTTPSRLAALVITHFHEESLTDILPVAALLPPDAPIFVPERAARTLNEFLGARRARRPLVQTSTGTETRRGDLTLRFVRAHHGCPGVATRVETTDASLVHLADTGARPWFARFAERADLLIAHTLTLDRDAASKLGETNMSAGGAARLAHAANVRRLGIAHIPFYGEAEASLREARAEFAATFVLAEGQSYEIGP
ncbi:MAG: MBL fold metallo-hydrolase [Thermoplasmatota archaeon]